MKPKKANLTNILGGGESISTATSITTTKADTKETPLPEPNSLDKKRLPKIIIITFDKEGKTIHEEFICAEVTLYKNSKTLLSGAKPTNRRDYMDISIEAKVVEV